MLSRRLHLETECGNEMREKNMALFHTVVWLQITVREYILALVARYSLKFTWQDLPHVEVTPLSPINDFADLRSPLSCTVWRAIAVSPISKVSHNEKGARLVARQGNIVDPGNLSESGS
jgi:hypothetical protein